MWRKKPFVDEIKRRIADIDLRRATDPAPENGAVITYAHERELRDALLWLAGKAATIDFKIESRQRGGVWSHTLKHGSMGYSAQNPLITITDGLSDSFD